MGDKDKQSEIFCSANEYKNYFADDEKSLDTLLKNLEDLQKITDDQIKTMVSAAPGRGVQHNLIEHMTNAVAIASQFQSVLKDKRSIKERSLDLAIKTNKEEVQASDMSEIIINMQKIIKENKNKQSAQVEKIKERIKSDEELDAEIEKKLGLD